MPTCGLFYGRLVDRPESVMPAIRETSGGWVEHEVYMLDGILLLVMELKLSLTNMHNHVAQVMLELSCTSTVYSSNSYLT